MDNPNIAPGTPIKCLDTVSPMPVPVTTGLGTSPKNVSVPYSMSNAASVEAPPHPFSSGPPVVGQPDMRPTGSIPSFEKLQPKNMPTAPGPMGFNYET
jgi:hypothetical protein